MSDPNYQSPLQGFVVWVNQSSNGTTWPGGQVAEAAVSKIDRNVIIDPGIIVKNVGLIGIQGAVFLLNRNENGESTGRNHVLADGINIWAQEDASIHINQPRIDANVRIQADPKAQITLGRDTWIESESFLHASRETSITTVKQSRILKQGEISALAGMKVKISGSQVKHLINAQIGNIDVGSQIICYGWDVQVPPGFRARFDSPESQNPIPIYGLRGDSQPSLRQSLDDLGYQYLSMHYDSMQLKAEGPCQLGKAIKPLPPEKPPASGQPHERLVQKFSLLQVKEAVENATQANNQKNDEAKKDDHEI